MTALTTAAEIMTRKPVTTVVTATVAQAIELMQAQGVSSLLVMPLSGTVEYGILTMRDVVTRVVGADVEPESVHVGDVMTWRLITAAPSWPVRRVAEVMAASRVRRLPVMDGPDIVGLISDTDVFTSLVEAHTWDHVRQARKARALARLSRTEPANTVADLMSAPVLAISGDATVQQAVEKMVSAGISSLLVEEEQVPHGIITKRDVVIKLVAAGRDPREAAVRTVASDPVQTIGFEATLEECSARMAVVGTRRLPVTRGGTIVGIISDSDILAAAAGHRWFGHRRAPTTAVAADFMRPPVAELQPVWTDALTPELSIWDCAERLMQAGARELPVVQEGRIIGIVSESDIVRALQERGGPD